MNWEHELESFLEAVKKTSLPVIKRKKVVMELIANGVAGLCAVIVYSLLQRYFVVKSIRNLWGLAARKDKMLVSKDTFEWMSTVVVFVVALFVFTYVEDLIEKYLEIREGRLKGKR